MSLPTVSYLKNPSIASYSILSGHNYQINMRFDDPGNPNDPNDPGDQGQAPDGLGFIYCTDTAARPGAPIAGSYMGWLNSDNETVTNRLIGNTLYAYLLLNLADDNNGNLIIGPNAGEKPKGSSKFPNAALLNYSFQNQHGSQSPPNAGNSNATAINTYNVGQVPNTVLYRKFEQSSSPQNGVLLTPAASPPFQRSVYVHVLDSDGNIKGVMDYTKVGRSYWFPMDANGLFVIASLGGFVDSLDPNKREFNVGDPRTGGSMTVQEV